MGNHLPNLHFWFQHVKVNFWGVDFYGFLYKTHGSFVGSTPRWKFQVWSPKSRWRKDFRGSKGPKFRILCLYLGGWTHGSDRNFTIVRNRWVSYNLFRGRNQPTCIGVIGHPVTKYQQDILVGINPHILS